MKNKILTLELPARKTLKVMRQFDDPTLEVDHDMSGMIHEIRVFSEYFCGFVAVNEAWLDNNFPASLATIQEAVALSAMEANGAPREFNNDDLIA